MWGLDHKEGWVPKNWCFQTVVLEKTLYSPLDNKEIKTVNPKRNQPWIFVGKDWCWSWSCNIWLPDGKSYSLEKTLMLEKIEDRKRMGWRRMRWLDDIINSMDMSLSKLQKMVKDRETWYVALHGFAKIGTWLSNWTTATIQNKMLKVRGKMNDR